MIDLHDTICVVIARTCIFIHIVAQYTCIRVCAYESSVSAELVYDALPDHCDAAAAETMARATDSTNNFVQRAKLRRIGRRARALAVASWAIFSAPSASE